MCCFVHSAKNFARKTLLRWKMYDLRIIFQKCLSKWFMLVLLNRTYIDIFKMRDDVYLFPYTVCVERPSPSSCN